jgi:hypothetical protein
MTILHDSITPVEVITVTQDIKAIWEGVKKEALKHIEFTFPLSEAFNAAIPLAIDEDGIFVLGFDGANFFRSGMLERPDVRLKLEEILTGGFKRPFALRIIHGTTPEDWTTAKSREQRAAEKREEAYAQMQGTGGAQSSFDELGMDLRRRYGAVEGRQYTQVKARFLLDNVPSILQTEKTVAEREGKGTDAFQRQLSRLIESLALTLDVAPLVVALEIERQRGKTE